ncbi:crossover junction endodeoxyribonuclease RuvC [Neobacillus sp. YIM B02564]|uniref:Crossover junction endodeoxyribonuclease RuvC n=1 Tax=Neobacillus paridis TaxID=2803862 RepID=A0ABS1TPI1_9BACI|nr:crossover junction endodeoxyribonuclease RuvC [Neobacillus paridis]MBL4952136.1 crossover junction endodeoxyribonuclease RuvC [Neobacillus paridis]
MVKGIAIDPGTRDIGYCYFNWMKEDSLLVLGESGIIRIKHSLDLEFRLHILFYRIQELVTDMEVLVTENSFSNPKYPSGITVREGLGVIKVAAVEKHVPIHLLRPEDSKLAMVGKRTASKLELAKAIEEAGIPLPSPAEVLIQKKKDHLTDAIGMVIAYCFKEKATVTIYSEKGEKLCPCLEKKRNGIGKSIPKTTKIGMSTNTVPAKKKAMKKESSTGKRKKEESHIPPSFSS